MVSELRRKRRVELDDLSLKLAVEVAGKVAGLTDSRLPGMDRRLEALFYLDVKPAIEARKEEPREDVISHLIEQGYGDSEILTECRTYAAAGMVATRELISIAVWRMLEQPSVRSRYSQAGEKERHALLEEILRLEPVIGNLYRRATPDIRLGGDTSVTLPAGSLINLHVYEANADESVAGTVRSRYVRDASYRRRRLDPP